MFKNVWNQKNFLIKLFVTNLNAQIWQILLTFEFIFLSGALNIFISKDCGRWWFYSVDEVKIILFDVINRILLMNSHVVFGQHSNKHLSHYKDHGQKSPNVNLNSFSLERNKKSHEKSG